MKAWAGELTLREPLEHTTARVPPALPLHVLAGLHMTRKVSSATPLALVKALAWLAEEVRYTVVLLAARGVRSRAQATAASSCSLPSLASLCQPVAGLLT